MWIARDKNKQLFLSVTKPIRNLQDNVWRVSDTSDCTDWMLLDESLFPNLTWEDEPEEVFLVMKNTLHKIICKECGKEFKYHNSDIKEWHDYQPSSGHEYGADYVNCPHCEGYNELTSW